MKTEQLKKVTYRIQDAFDGFKTVTGYAVQSTRAPIHFAVDERWPGCWMVTQWETGCQIPIGIAGAASRSEAIDQAVQKINAIPLQKWIEAIHFVGTKRLSLPAA